MILMCSVQALPQQIMVVEFLMVLSERVVPGKIPLMETIKGDNVLIFDIFMMKMETDFL